MDNLLGGKNPLLKCSCFVIVNLNDASVDLNKDKTDGGCFYFHDFFLIVNKVNNKKRSPFCKELVEEDKDSGV